MPSVPPRVRAKATAPADGAQVAALDRVLGGDIAAGEDRTEAEAGDHQYGRGAIGGEIRGEEGEEEEDRRR